MPERCRPKMGELLKCGWTVRLGWTHVQTQHKLFRPFGRLNGAVARESNSVAEACFMPFARGLESLKQLIRSHLTDTYARGMLLINGWQSSTQSARCCLYLSWRIT